VVCVYQSALLQPVRIPVGAVVTGFGVLGLLRSPLGLGVLEFALWGSGRSPDKIKKMSII